MDKFEVVKSVLAFVAVCSIALLFVVGGIILPIRLIVSYICDGELMLALLTALLVVVMLSVVALCVMEVI